MEFLIFDFDDTMATSGSAQRDAFMLWAKERGYLVEEEDVTAFLAFKNSSSHTGITFMNTFFDFFEAKEIGFNRDEVEIDMNNFVCGALSVSEEVKLNGNLYKLLNYGAGRRQFSIATGGSQEIIGAKLRNPNLDPIRDKLSFEKGNIFCANYVGNGRSKPNPDVFLYAFCRMIEKNLEENPGALSLGVNVSMFDDSFAGVKSAIGARDLLMGDLVILSETLKNIGIDGLVVKTIYKMRIAGKIQAKTIMCVEPKYGIEVNQKTRDLNPDFVIEDMNNACRDFSLNASRVRRRV